MQALIWNPRLRLALWIFALAAGGTILVFLVNLAGNSEGHSIFLPVIRRDKPAASPIYYDDFSTDRGWQPWLTPGGQAGVLDHQYRLFHNQPGQVLISLSPLSGNAFPAGGYAIEVTAIGTAGLDLRYGILFEWVDNTKFSLFIIQPQYQTYVVYHFENNSYGVPWTGGMSEAILPGNFSNRLRLVRDSTSARIYVNSVQLGPEITNKPILNGKPAGLIAITGSSLPAEVRFDGFIIEKLP
jgi:hypothetical protein